jgi:membrane protein
MLRATYQQWAEAKAPRLGAALAFYAVISLAPLLVLLLAVAGLVFGADAAAGRIVQETRGIVGQPVAEVVQEMVRQASQPWSGVLATVISLGVLLFGASGVFDSLQDALNTIWRVAPKPDRWLLALIRDRFFAILFVLATGLLLIASVVLTSVLAALETYWAAEVPLPYWFWEGVNTGASFAVIAVLFALIYKYLPDAKVRWGDVWVGAAGTAVLFNVGKHLLALYLTYVGPSSSYGAAGSLVVMLLWVYYSAQVLLLGAAFTHVYAQRYGAGVRPGANAMLLGPTRWKEEG